MKLSEIKAMKEASYNMAEAKVDKIYDIIMNYKPSKGQSLCKGYCERLKSSGNGRMITPLNCVTYYVEHPAIDMATKGLLLQTLAQYNYHQGQASSLVAMITKIEQEQSSKQ